ncbi:hypothetical protein AXG93_939s1210 [Marchantia polymorpha subsp. ruderalis]|uniref:Uncharacterized protein n=1 Tax=Marchantia polymorpha subsp. ruderalis TaxID=1480154 RepID=A0A176VMG9_MARPO|nr:hypothetical protein AXG93_939s1210 [Marchantia polymorpha subsp. ruderalis]
MGFMEGKETRPTTPPDFATSTPASGPMSKKEWDDKNLISLAMFGHYQLLIAHCETAAEAWAELQNANESHDIPMQMHLRDALHTSQEKCRSFEIISEFEAYTCLLRSLPLEYRSFEKVKR